jgi:6-phosphofructokinase 2
MPKIVTLTMNPAVDISTSVALIEPVRKLRCRPETREAGGGGINVARVIHRLGGDVLAVYLAGGVVGELLKKQVAREGVPSLVVPIAGETRESFTVTDETTRDEFRFVMPGPTLTEEEWRACLAQVEAALDGAGYLVVSGSLPTGTPQDFHAQLGAMARRVKARFVVDASGAQLKSALDAGVYLAKPNLRELEDITASALGERSAQVAACRRIIGSGKAEILALTMGSDGALVVTRDEAWFADPLSVEINGTVGAGDSFLAALTCALASGASLDGALRNGVAAGTAALTTVGTKLASPEDIRRLAERVRLSRM